jgi:hypothetical protein
VKGDSVTTWLYFPAGDGFTAAYRAVPEQGDTVVAELRVLRGEPNARWLDGPCPEEPVDTSKPITARLIRNLPVATHLARIRSDVMTDEASEEIGTTFAWLGYTDALLAVPTRTSRRTVGENVYLAVSIHYAHACAADSKTPIKDTQRALADRGLFYTTAHIKTLVSEARRRGYLTPAPGAGMSGGELTPKAADVLRHVLGY